jgi:uncharacterized integral membrane protein (TIGR00698 family)
VLATGGQHECGFRAGERDRFRARPPAVAAQTGLMRLPQWLPGRSDGPGLTLALALGGAAVALVRALPAHPVLSDVLVALALGALVVNTPLARVLGLAPADRDGDRYAPGLRFVGKWLLRLSIVLMGLKVEARHLGTETLALVAAVPFALPVTFLLTHALAVPLGIRRPLADLVAAGTMICGASAVNAVAPVVGARRQEQAIALATVFLFSVAALVLFRPLAALCRLPPEVAGVWSGLAVNDLASSVAVGAQMGPGGAELAAAAKSLRIVLLAPVMILLALARRAQPAPRELGREASRHLPLFVIGFVALAAARAAGDRLLAGAPAWRLLLGADRTLVEGATAAIAAAIGLHLRLGDVRAAGARALVLGAAAAAAMAALTLAFVTLASRGRAAEAVALGTAALLAAVGARRVAAASETAASALERRLAAGAPLALVEAIELLARHEAEGPPDEAHLRRIMRQLHPSIGELTLVRESPLPHGQGCRWATYWEGASGWALVAVCRAPGSSTPIHAHPHRLIGKPIEGRVEELRFAEREPGRLVLESRRPLAHGDLIESDGLATIHLVRVAGDRPAIDVQLRGPEPGHAGVEYVSAGALDPGALAVGDVVAARRQQDRRPGQGGDGAHAGLVGGPWPARRGLKLGAPRTFS